MRPRVPAWVVPTVITVAAAVLFLVRLSVPADIVFDEVYYVEDARSYLDAGVESGFAVHPPVGKWLIAAGIAIVGDSPFGWRMAGALAGAATVLMTVLLTRRLTGRAALAALAGGLLALDGVFVVQARTAMLDVFLAGFVVLGAYLLVVDHQRPRAGGVLERWPLALAGVAFGVAVATKWSGGLAGFAAIGLVAVWEYRARRPHPHATSEPGGEDEGPAEVEEPAEQEAAAGAPVVLSRGRAMTAAMLALVLGLGVPATLAYAASWTPWLVQYEGTRTAQTICAEQEMTASCRFSAADRVAGLVRHHQDVAGFHLDLDAEHPYRAPATTWPVQARPVVYHWDSCGADDDPATCTVAPGNAAEIVGLGNPVLWWGGLLLLPVLLAGAVRRDQRSAVPVAFLAAQYLPWLVVARPVFSFYAVPLVPFLAAGVAVACGELDRPRRWLATASGTTFGAAAGAIVATVVGADGYGVGTAAAVTGLTGAAVGAAIDGIHPLGQDRPPSRPVGTYVAAGLGLLAVAAAVYFAPIWLAIELPEEQIRHRWWFDSWI